MSRAVKGIAACLLVLAALGAPAADARVPVVRIEVEDRLRETKKVAGQMRVPGSGGFTGRVGIELRGSSSRFVEKRSFALETRRRDGEARSVRLLGMPSENDWVLNAASMDPTLMRDVLAHAAARRVGRYAARSRFVELHLNGRYHGLYVLTERPKLDEGRLDISRKGISGGYLLELSDKLTRSQAGDGFRLPATRRPALYADPDKGDLNKREERYISRFAGRAERALYGMGGDWRVFLDERSAIDFALIHELFKNDDAFLRSVFLHKATAAPLVFGPVWDFDRSSGNPVATPHVSADGWASPAHPWAERLFRDPAFVDRLIARWRALRAAGLVEHVLQTTDETASLLAGAPARNARRWPDHQGRGFAGEVAALKQWLAARAAWIDANVEVLRP